MKREAGEEQLEDLFLFPPKGSIKPWLTLKLSHREDLNWTQSTWKMILLDAAEVKNW